MEQIEFEFSILKNIRNNLLKKPKNRIYTRSTILNKLKETKEAHDNISDILTILETDLDIETFNKINKKAKEISSAIYLQLHQMLVTSTTSSKFKTYAILVLSVVRFRKTFTMANVEIIKTVSTLMPSYDGSMDKLDSTIDALEVIETLVTDANRATIINVILTKLSGRARHTFVVKPADLQELKTKLKAVVTVTPPETIISKMIATKQKTDLATFTTEIESLATQLENAYISKKIPNDVAKELSTKEAIKHMASGLKNEKTALILQVGTFNQLAEAINKIHEVNPTCEANVMFARANRNANKPSQSNETWMSRNAPYNQNRFGNRYSNQRFNPNSQGRSSSRHQQYGHRYEGRNDDRQSFSRRQNFNHTQQGHYSHQPNGHWRSNNNNNNHNCNTDRNDRNVYSTENGRGPAATPQASCAVPMNQQGETRHQATNPIQQVQRTNNQ